MKPPRRTLKNSAERSILARTGGHWFVRLLQEKGVEFVFGTTGAGMPDIQDAMVVEKPPKWIQGLHEFVSVSAASGYGLASGRAGVSLIDRIVGTQNAVGAVYGAYLNCSPAVIFASANVPGVPMDSTVPELHFSGQQVMMVSQWTKWSTQLSSLETLPEDIDKAFHAALSETRGPVYVTLRQDLMAQRVRKVRTSQNWEPLISRRVPDDETIGRIMGELLSHDHPQIVTSHLGRRTEAVKPLVEFAHLFGAAVKERRFFMNYPSLDPLHAGFLSRYAPPRLMPSTDLVITLEMGLLPHQRFSKETDAIDLASDPFHRQDVYAGGDYGSSLFPASVRAACDVGETLRKIVKAARVRLTSTERATIRERSARLRGAHSENVRRWRERARSSYDAGRLDDWSVGYVVNRHISRRPSICWINGTASSWETLLKTVELNAPGTYFGNPSGHLGVGVGMAYGAALARRRYGAVRDHGKFKAGKILGAGWPVICTVGDGDAIFGNIDSALWTCRHYGIGVVYLILNNACWAAEWIPIEESSQHWARDARDFEFLDIDEPRIDFRRLGGAFDVESASVDTPKGLDSALRRGLELAEKGVPALVDIVMEKYTKGKSVVP